MSRILQILLVEDSSSDRFLALEALADAQMPNNVHAVDDGVQALDFLRRTGQYPQVPRPDLILLDLNLPRKDGRQVLADLKADPDLRKIPVVILATSGDASGEGLTSYPEHAQSYLTKPIEVKQFDEIIRIFQYLWFPDLANLRTSRTQATVSSTDRSVAIPLPIPQDSVTTTSDFCALSSILTTDANEALVITDAHSNTLWVNEAFTRMCGYSIRELMGRKLATLLQGPKTDQAAEIRMKKAVAGGNSCTEEIVKYHKDGHPYWVRLMINPVTGPDGVLRGSLTVEKQLLHKQI